VTPWHVAVIVPAHDEEDRIEACVDSIRRAVAAVTLVAVEARILVVADRCRDGTVRRATERLGRDGAVVAVAAGSAAAARASGASIAIGRHHGRLDHLWLANTDADTTVPRDWLDQQLHLARLGVAAVAGTVAVDSFAEHPPHVPEAWHARYDGPAHLPHPHVHGANLGVRADAYAAVGGWPERPCGEDHGLWAALRGAGYRCASPRSLVVTTSGRAVSRARGGFADVLNRLAAAS
jgi:cellulose synthase/poly-beta-1,6-N-acetylglucosamine synthase-like glycosyltransferase